MTKGTGRWLRAALVGLAVVAVGASAWAEAIAVNLVTKVRQGQNPSVELTAEETAKRTVVELTRSDGKKLTYRIGTLHAGRSKQIKLPGDPGKFSYEGRISAIVDGEGYESPLGFDTVVAAPLQVKVDKSKVDLKKQRLEIELSRTAGFVNVKVLDPSGSVLDERDHDFTGKAPGTPLVVDWSVSEGAEVARIEIRAYDADGFFSGIALMPWSVSIAHEEVNFETDSAKIRGSEVPKLRDSQVEISDTLKRYRQLKGVKLFIAGHTDTVGTPAYNLQLSRRRAQSIASWFGRNGLRIPIYYEGFGESAPKVKTGDNVDEPRNRRVDYILAIEPPGMKSGQQPAWKKVR